MSERKRRGGRPTAYTPELAAQAQALCQLGATDAELADFFGVAISTVGLWKTRHREFSEALKAGKGEVDDRVERSLLQRALGYTYDAVKIFPPRTVVRRNKGKKTTVEVRPVIVPYREHVPPDVVAAIFWLKNRRRDEWRDVQRHEHDGEIKLGLSERLERAIARAGEGAATSRAKPTGKRDGKKRAPGDPPRRSSG